MVELDLTNFFGVEPSKADSADVPWPYNEFTFNVADENWSARFFICPRFNEIELDIQVAGQLFYRLVATGYRDLIIHNDPSHDTLEIVISSGQSIFLRITPSLFVSQEIRDGI